MRRKTHQSSWVYGRESQTVKSVQAVLLDCDPKRYERVVHNASTVPFIGVVSRTADHQMFEVHKGGECSHERRNIRCGMEKWRILSREDRRGASIAVLWHPSSRFLDLRHIGVRQLSSGLRLDKGR